MNTESGAHRCEEVRRLVAERTDRLLLPGETRLVAEHLFRCVHCREFAEELDAVLDLYVTDLSTQAARLGGPAFTDRVLAAVESRRRQGEERPQSQRHLVLRPALLVAASLLVALIAATLFLRRPAAQLLAGHAALVLREGPADPWVPAGNREALSAGTTLYVVPGGEVRLHYARAGERLVLSGDTLLRLLPAGPSLEYGRLLVASAKETQVLTPVGPVRLRGGEAFLEVALPDDPILAPPAAGREARQMAVRVLRGEATVAGQTLRAGEARVVVPGGSAFAPTPAEERSLEAALGAFGRGVPAWLPPPDRPLAESLAAAVAGPGREAAVHVAARLKLRAVVEKAWQALHSRGGAADAGFRRLLARALGAVGAATPLVGLLADPDPEVRRLAARAAGLLKRPEGLAALERLLTDPDQPAVVRFEAARALAAAGRPAPAELLRGLARDASYERLRELAEAVEDNARPLPQAAVRRLGAMLLDASLETRLRILAARLLRVARDPVVVGYALKALDDPDARVREAGLTVLYVLALHEHALSRAARAQLLRVLRRPGVGPAELKRALELCVAAEVADRAELVRLTRQEKLPPEVRALAAGALGRYPAARITPASLRDLYRELAQRRTPPAVKAALLSAYGRVAQAPDVPWLLQRLQEPAAAVVQAAVLALKEARERRVPLPAETVATLEGLLRRTQDSGVAKACRFALVKLVPPPRAVAILAQELARRKDPKTLAEIANALALIPSLEAAEAVRPLLDHSDPRVALAAVRALGRIGKGAAPLLPDLLRRFEGLSASDPELRNPLAYGLALTLLKLGEVRRVLPRLVRIIEDEGPRAGETVKAVAQVLGPQVLLPYRQLGYGDLRLTLARAFLAEEPTGPRLELRRWYEEETDPWTRFTLAVALLPKDRGPLTWEVRHLAVTAGSTFRQALARAVGEPSLEKLLERLEDLSRPIPEGWRAKLARFIRKNAIPRAPGLERRSIGWRRGLGTELLGAGLSARYQELRLRLVRQLLLSPSPTARKAGLLEARVLPIPQLVPLAAERLEDPDPGVRRAARDLLSELVPESVAGYDPELQGEALHRAAQEAKRKLSQADLSRRLPGLVVALVAAE